jgi:Tol biopolymer transport system component
MLRVHRRFIEFRYTASHTASGKRRRAETLYGLARKRADLLKMSLVTSAAMLAICLLALVETTNTAEAEDSLPENGKTAFHSGDGNIYSVEPDGSNLRVLIPGGGGAPKWSPDGTEIICPMCNAANAGVMRADGSNMRPIPGDSPTWSADGTSVAFSDYHYDMQRGQSNDMDIFMVDLDTSKQTTLRRTPKLSEAAVDFSPDGSQICFFNDDTELDTGRPIPGDKPMGIYVMDVHGSDPPPTISGR